MSLLASLFSTIDSKKREMADVVGNPVQSLMQKIGDVNDRARAFNELNDAALAERMAGQGVNSPAQARLAQTLAESYNPMAMTVYHGSPHLFSRFDASKIGTGEGAQAYGHGLYLAQSPQVAKSYVPRDMAYESRLLDMYKRAERSGNYDAMDVLESAMTHSTPSELRKQYGKASEGLIKQIESIPYKAGALYRVDLPDEQIAKMLDWDKPLSQQPAAVQQFAQQRGVPLEDLGGDLIAAVRGKTPAGAAAIKQAGIPGIRYLDEGSRGYGQGTSNFVVFPGMEDILRIEQINGMPPGSLFDMIGR
jgi:hypothetical protein